MLTRQLVEQPTHTNFTKYWWWMLAHFGIASRFLREFSLHFSLKAGASFWGHSCCQRWIHAAVAARLPGQICGRSLLPAGLVSTFRRHSTGRYQISPRRRHFMLTSKYAHHVSLSLSNMCPFTHSFAIAPLYAPRRFWHFPIAFMSSGTWTPKWLPAALTRISRTWHGSTRREKRQVSSDAPDFFSASLKHTLWQAQVEKAASTSAHQPGEIIPFVFCLRHRVAWAKSIFRCSATWRTPSPKTMASIWRIWAIRCAACSSSTRRAFYGKSQWTIYRSAVVWTRRYGWCRRSSTPTATVKCAQLDGNRAAPLWAATKNKKNSDMLSVATDYSWFSLFFSDCTESKGEDQVFRKGEQVGLTGWMPPTSNSPRTISLLVSKRPKYQ